MGDGLKRALAVVKKSNKDARLRAPIAREVWHCGALAVLCGEELRCLVCGATIVTEAKPERREHAFRVEAALKTQEKR